MRAEHRLYARSRRIVVTARRRNEILLDVPIAVTAYTGEQLNRQGALDITDIADTTPNVTLEVSRGTNSTLTAFIRGVGQQDPVAGFEAGVGIYLDDVYLNRPQAAVLDVYDVERIEVLRGPQGTLYGRNTIGGAVKYVTKGLPDEPSFRVRATVGTYDQADLVIGAAGPLSDNVRVGATFARLSRGGFGDNLTTGLENYNRDIWAGRLAAELEHLSTTGREEIAKRIEAAREEGDLKENGGYHAAKDEQGKQEARIRQLEQLLRDAKVGQAPPDDGVVEPGMVVEAEVGGSSMRFLLGSREVSDGELDEGSTWEAAMACAHHGLDNVTAIVDVNALQADGPTVGVLRTEPVRTQAALAKSIGADKTRLIPVLDELQRRGLIDGHVRFPPGRPAGRPEGSVGRHHDEPAQHRAEDVERPVHGGQVDLGVGGGRGPGGRAQPDHARRARSQRFAHVHGG